MKLSGMIITKIFLLYIWNMPAYCCDILTKLNKLTNSKYWTIRPLGTVLCCGIICTTIGDLLTTDSKKNLDNIDIIIVTLVWIGWQILWHIFDKKWQEMVVKRPFMSHFWIESVYTLCKLKRNWPEFRRIGQSVIFY